jgi:gephyrin
MSIVFLGCVRDSCVNACLCRPTLILGLTWQLIKAHLLRNISLRNVPELIVLLQEGEDVDAFHRLPPEQILLRWVNYHSKKSGLTDKRASNFGSDVSDSELYRAVLYSLNCYLNKQHVHATVPSASEEPSAHTRALRVISSARSLGIATFIKADDIVDGNVKLNIGFVAQLFNKCHGLVLEPAPGSKIAAADDANTQSATASAPSQRKYPMIAVADAISLVLANTQPLDVQWDTPLITACGRVSASTVHSSAPFPSFPASIMDGYALVGPVTEGNYDLISAVRAGDRDSNTSGEDGAAAAPGLQAGQCVYITTGAKLPKGADTVIKIEDTTLVTPASATQPGVVLIRAGATVGTNVRQIGSDIAENECLLTPGRVITPVDVGLLATIGCATVSTFAKPVIGVLSTGNELIEHTQTPSGSQIRDSNRVAMIAAFRHDGYECVDLGIIPDTNVDDVCTHLLRYAQSCDIVVTSGGVSMGDADFVKPALERIGTVHFGKLNMKPGKPTMFATVVQQQKRTLFFGLPGNPVSCLVTKSLLIDPCLKRLQGLPALDCLHPQLNATLVGDKPIVLDPERPEYHRAFLTVAQVPADEQQQQQQQQVESSDKDSSLVSANTTTSAASSVATKQQFQVRSTGNQRSSRLLSMRGSNAVLCLAQGPGVVNIGDEVSYFFLSSSHVCKLVCML